MKSKGIFISLAAALLFMLYGCSKSGPPEISIKWPKGLLEGTDAAVFMVILNEGESSDLLTGCSVKEIPDLVCELHDIVDGRMKIVKALDVPPKGTLELRPRGRHIMLIGAGQAGVRKVTIRLNFEKSGDKEARTELVR
jgi:hypothetical protein